MVVLDRIFLYQNFSLALGVFLRHELSSPGVVIFAKVNGSILGDTFKPGRYISSGVNSGWLNSLHIS